jgi:Flp pilus assembly protein TadG
MRMCRSKTAERTRRRARGQALVEFALVIPIFLVVVVAIAEFAFLVTIKFGVTYAAQDATAIAAELGNAPNADIYVLNQVEKDLMAPVDKAKVLSVAIYWTDSNGVNKGSNTWTRTGLTTAGGITVPYTLASAGYPVANRCNIVLATGCAPGHTGVDWIGVTITYQYSWVTPLPGMIGLGGTPPTFVETTTSRLEPIQ